MKKMRKLFAVVLALAMVMGMTMMASAAGNHKLTITNADGATVKYAQIIKEDRTSTLGWQFASPNIANKFVAGWNSTTNPAETATANDVIAAMIASNMIENPANYNVENKVINASAKFSAALANVTEYATTPFDTANGVAVSETGKGLYLIVAQKTGYTYLPMAAYMDSQGTDVAVQAKGAKDQVNKTVDDAGISVAPGDEVPYTITEEYAYIAPNATKTFTITDTLTNGTFKANSVSVKIGDDAATEGTDYTINYVGKTTFTIDFGAKYNSAYAGKTIEITYTAIAGTVTTEAPLKNNVVSSNKTGAMVEVKPVSFTVIKVDENDNKKLEGAKFQIYKDVAQGTAGAEELTLENKTVVYGLALGKEITTDENGKASVNNLDAQETYYVKEIEAPNGYRLNDIAYKLEGANVTKNTDTTKEEKDVTYTVTTYTYTNFADITVKDTKLSALPSTGGIGTTIFTIAGCAIMIAAAGLFFASRKKEQQ